MPRLPRLEYPNAIYHVITRGDGRRKLFHDARHYERFTQGLSDEVDRSSWLVIAFCWMPNHIHALIRTPRPNLCKGMQHWLSGYANWYAKRNRRTGHLFQGRYKAFLVEDEGYYWNLSRYIHLNPCMGGKPLALTPEAYPNSSYGGYARKSRQLDWIAYEEHHRYWTGLHGGSDPFSSYRKFVKQGLTGEVDSKVDRLRDWVYGSEDFLKRMLAMAAGEDVDENDRRIRKTHPLSAEQIIGAVADYYHVEPQAYRIFRSPAGGRDLAAYLCRRYSGITLRELSLQFGLSHPDGSANLVRRAKARLKESVKLRNECQKIEELLGLKTEDQV
ncbi:transposase [Novipirellula aureliae]|uniref:transposase n=1 Tax=Novipirellula aureliae TaxID=2527966 RepID=UPI0018CE66A8|nr:transposase [Novipirellula aureliae]